MTNPLPGVATLTLPTLPRPAWVRELDERGFVVIADALPPDLVDALLAELDGLPAREAELVYAAGVYGVRSLFNLLPGIRALVRAPEIRSLIEPLLGPSALAVKATLYDKTPDANWKIGWHQDAAIAVRERRDVPGFGFWSDRAGVPHVQAPGSLRSEMLAVRLHLDPCAAENGALRVIPGSHRHGRLGPAEVFAGIKNIPEVTCPVPRGGALLMRPLLLHTSHPAVNPAHRRVVHIEYALGKLPGGLEWFE